MIDLTLGDCVVVMAEMEADSIDAIVCDPPYGLEFMGKQWDRLDGDAWRDGGGLSNTGLGDRPTQWVSFGQGDTANATCATCGGRMRGAKRCECLTPDWRVKGEPMAAKVDTRVLQSQKMQQWHGLWAEQAYRVLKPGGHLLAFGGTRTYHRMACAIEDAGFEIRDSVMWLYGSGFPKSHDVSKGIDKAAGVERTQVKGVKPGHEDFVDRTDAHSAGGRSDGWERPWREDPHQVAASHMQMAPATAEAEQWQGWGSALKPAHEPVVVARKPIIGTLATNVMKYGTGALNIDATRIAHGTEVDLEAVQRQHAENPLQIGGAKPGDVIQTYKPGGRWPANVVLSHADGCVEVGTKKIKGITGTASGRMGPDYQSGVYGGYTGNSEEFGKPTGYVDADGTETVESWTCVAGCPVVELDAQSGQSASSGKGAVKHQTGSTRDGNTGPALGGESRPEGTEMIAYSDKGGASRFFYCAKTSRSERNAGLDSFDERPLLWSAGEQNPGSFQAEGTHKAAKNNHPTVKPIALMRWLCRLVTRPGGVVLDPFMGSGTTGIACIQEGFSFLGIERDPHYFAIAQARIAHAEGSLSQQSPLF